MSRTRAVDALSKLLNALLFLEKRPFHLSSGEVLHPSEAHMLDAVERLERGNVQKLAAELGVTKGAVSQMVTRLEAKRLLVRRQGDSGIGRNVVPELTPAGRRVHQELHAQRSAFRKAIAGEVERLGADEAAFLAGFLERTVDHLRRLEADVLSGNSSMKATPGKHLPA